MPKAPQPLIWIADGALDDFAKRNAKTHGPIDSRDGGSIAAASAKTPWHHVVSARIAISGGVSLAVAIPFKKVCDLRNPSREDGEGLDATVEAVTTGPTSSIGEAMRSKNLTSDHRRQPEAMRCAPLCTTLGRGRQPPTGFVEGSICCRWAKCEWYGRGWVHPYRRTTCVADAKRKTSCHVSDKLYKVTGRGPARTHAAPVLVRLFKARSPRECPMSLNTDSGNTARSTTSSSVPQATLPLSASLTISKAHRTKTR